MRADATQGGQQEATLLHTGARAAATAAVVDAVWLWFVVVIAVSAMIKQGEIALGRRAGYYTDAERGAPLNSDAGREAPLTA